MAHKILVVDDDASVRGVLVRFLKKLGYAVAEAADGAAGLEAVKNDSPSLVLLDIQMPKMTGIEFLREARKLRPELAVIMVTGQGDEEVAQEAMKLGAVDYVSKPLDFGYLETSVKAKLATLLK